MLVFILRERDDATDIDWGICILGGAACLYQDGHGGGLRAGFSQNGWSDGTSDWNAGSSVLMTGREKSKLLAVG
jgi:hypothetical protein